MTASLPPSQDDPVDALDVPAPVPPLPDISAAEAAGTTKAGSAAPRKPRAKSTGAPRSGGAPRTKKPARSGAAAPPKPRVSAAEAAAQFDGDVSSAKTDATPDAVVDAPESGAVDAPAAEPVVAAAAIEVVEPVTAIGDGGQQPAARPKPRAPRKKKAVPPPEPVEAADPVEPTAATPVEPAEAVETVDAAETAEAAEAVESTSVEALELDDEVVEFVETRATPDHAPDPFAVEAIAVDADGISADPLAELPDVDVDDTVPALRLRGVSKSFGETRAVDAIDLTIAAGTFYGVVGPNGAGKTTTLSMIAGLLRPDRGSIEIAGVDLRAQPRRAKRLMGILPDRLRTFDRLTGRQLLHYYGVLRGLRPAVVESRAADLARAFDLTDALGRTVADYSAGMTKKVMLAGAMIHSPRVLVLDEPFEAVDPVSSAVILDILKAYVAHGGTLILSSHGMDLVERVCSGVAVIVAGQVLAEGTVEQVRGELTLEQRFIELAGGLSDVEGLEWLHTFSG